jgi:hypothetical protein
MNNTIITDRPIGNNSNVERIEVLYYDKLMVLNSDPDIDYTGYYIKTGMGETAKILACFDGKIIVDTPFINIPDVGTKVVLSKYSSFEEHIEIVIAIYVETLKLNHMKDSFYDGYHIDTSIVKAYFRNTTILDNNISFHDNEISDLFITKYDIDTEFQGIKKKILRLNNVDNIFAGDYIRNLDNEERKIKNIEQNIIILEEDFTSLPSVGDSLLVVKNNT